MHNEAVVIAGLKSGKEEAVEAIICLYGDGLLRTALAITGDLQVAEEVVQDALLQVCRKIRSFQGKSSLQTWIFRIAINLAKNRLRGGWFRRVTTWSDAGAYPVPAPVGDNPEADEAQNYYKLLIKRFPYTDEAARALFFTAQQAIPAFGSGEQPNLIYIFPTSTFRTSTGMNDDPARQMDLQEAIDQLKLVRERFPQSPWAQHALRELGKAYYALGDYANALWYLQASIEESQMEASDSTELMARIYLTRGDYQQALELVERSLQEKPGSNPLEMEKLKGQALMAMGQWQAARKIFQALPKKADAFLSRIYEGQNQESKALNIGNWDEVAQGYLRQLEGLESGKGESGELSGKVLLDGQGLAGAHVYLIDRAIYQEYYSSNTRDLRQVLTGPEGEFTFTGLIPGRYALGVGVRAEEVQGHTLRQWKEDVVLAAGETARRDLRFVPIVQLQSPLGGETEEGLVTFAWSPVAEAENYEVFIGSVTRDALGKITAAYTTVLRGGVKENQVTVDMGEEASKSRFSGSYGYQNGEITPRSILGLLYGGGEYTWGVNAYDATGNRIADSTGYGFYFREKQLPLFKVKGQELSEADRLLLEQKYDAAVTAYRQQVEAVPDDFHSLLSLARIYRYGIRPEEADLAQAATYYEQLLEVRDIPEVRGALADIYYQTGRDDLAESMYRSLLGTTEESWYTHYRLARIRFSEGSPEKALDILDQVVDMENGKYVRAFPVALALLLGDNKRAIDFAGRVDRIEEYLDLLKQYLGEGHTVKPTVRQAVLQGQYGQAVELLTSERHDLFLRGLLIYITNRSHPMQPREELAQLVKDMGPGLPADLLKLMMR